ncbi:MAG: hypothetical protein AAF602_15005 [Myxococcota bacterium]
MAIPTADPWLRSTNLALLALLAGVCGCIPAYHPLTGLHDPVVVDPRQRNLEGVGMTVRCVGGDALNGEENGRLCQHVGEVLQEQGARVSLAEEGGEIVALDDLEAAEAADPDVDLLVVVTSRQVHTRRPTFLNGLFFLASATLFPVIREQTFAQDIVVRDASGALLKSHRLEGRIVERGGVGTALVTGLANLGRPREERVSERRTKEDMTGDLDRQLSQAIFDATMRWRVLQESRPAAGESP